MSTDYYAVGADHEGACEHCSQRGERSLICTSFRIFRAYPGSDDGLCEPITGGSVMSWEEWKSIISSPVVDRVEDEYGKTYTKLEFIGMVEAISLEQRQETYDLEEKRRQEVAFYQQAPYTDWQDERSLFRFDPEMS